MISTVHSQSDSCLVLQQSMTIVKHQSGAMIEGHNSKSDAPKSCHHLHQAPTFVEACSQCDEKIVRYYLEKNIGKNELNFKDKTGKVSN